MMQRDSVSVPGLKRTRWSRFKAGLAVRLRKLWRPLLYAGVLLGFLLGRALPGSQIAPFGLAFYAAVRGAGFRPEKALPVGFAVMAGSMTVLPVTQLSWVLVGLGVCHALGTLAKVGRRGPAPLAAAVMGSVAAVIPALFAHRLGTVSLLFWVGLTGALALIFTLGIADAISGKALKSSVADAPVPVIVLLAAALCGLAGLDPWPWLSLRDTASSLLVLTCAYVGGPPLGSAAAAVLSITFLFNLFDAQPVTLSVLSGGGLGGQDLRTVAYVAAGLLAGTFRELRKAGVAVAFCLGLVTTAAAILPDPAQLFRMAYSAGAAALIFLAIPWAWLARIPSLLRVQDVGDEGGGAEAASPEAILAGRIRGMSRALKEVGRTLEQVAAVQAVDEDVADRVMEHVATRVCATCSMMPHCWKKELEKTQQLYTDLWLRIEESGPLPVQPVPDNLQSHCIYPTEVAVTLNGAHDLQRSHRHWERRFAEGRSVVGDYVRTIARQLDRFADQTEDLDQAHTSESGTVLRVTSGVARLPKRGGHISGDSYAGVPLGADRYLLALSDGMGVGRRAALESKQCIKLLQELLAAGFTTELAVQTVNSALLLRSPEETFATIDLALLDLATGKAEFVKVGASPSFVKRVGDVTVVKMASAPAGIINQVQVESEYRLLRPGDVIVMMTDGIWDVAKEDADKEAWLVEYLTREAAQDPTEIAEGVLAQALEIMPDAGDDMTVLVARVESASLGLNDGEVTGPNIRTWVPLRKAPRERDEPANRPVS